MRFTQLILLPFLTVSVVGASLPASGNLNEVAQSGPSSGGPGHRRFAEPEPDPSSGPSSRGPGHRRFAEPEPDPSSGPSSRGPGHRRRDMDDIIQLDHIQ